MAGKDNFAIEYLGKGEGLDVDVVSSALRAAVRDHDSH